MYQLSKVTYFLKRFFVSNLECFEQWLPLFSLADNSLSKFNNNWIIFLCPLSIWWSFNAILCNASHCWLHKTWPEHWSLEGPLLYGEFPELRSYKMRQNFSALLFRLFLKFRQCTQKEVLKLIWSNLT